MRYICMDDAVNDNERRFAFWDTVRDRFVDVGGDQSWGSVADLDLSFDALVHDYDTGIHDLPELEAQRERLIGLARGNHALEQVPPEDPS